MQSETGVQALRADIRTPHEEAVFNNIQFMESVHAKSYSSIFLLWIPSQKSKRFSNGPTPILSFKRRQKSSTKSISMGPSWKESRQRFPWNLPLLLWFLHTSLLSWNNKLANVAEIIKLIIRDESVHGTYIGYKFQLGFNELPEDEQENSKSGCMIFSTLYENEELYREPLWRCWLDWGSQDLPSLQR